jgi:YD repeat-containing protein
VFATTYSDGTTPNVTNYFDRLGRVTNIVTATESQFLTYSDSGRVLLETNAAGTLAKFSLTHGYDSFLRRTSLTVRSNTTALYNPTHAYDSRSSRLTNAADGAYSATYEYLANSPLVSQITFRSNSVTAMTTTKQYDYLIRLLRISSVPSADAAVNFDYLYNDANQRTRRTDPDGSYWLYEYDKLGQLTSGKHY